MLRKILNLRTRHWPGLRNFSSHEEKSYAATLLKNAATFIDRKPTSPEDKWSTLPYPQSAVIDKNRNDEDEEKRQQMDPSDTSVILFPGDGHQHAGMAKGMISCPSARDLFEMANEMLGYDLLKLCLEGPKSKLKQIVYAHPAIFTTSLAAVHSLQEIRPNAIENCIATAGYSLGEITALVFAGAFSFEEALRLVEIRAEAIQLANDRGGYGTAKVKTGPAANLQRACEKAREYCKTQKGIPDAECAISSYIYPSNKFVTGHNEALIYLQENKEKLGLFTVEKSYQLGAEHGSRMHSVRGHIKEAINSMKVSDPIIPVYSNIDGQRYENAAHIRQNLPKQITSPIKWEQAMMIIYGRSATNFPRTFTCGPSNEILWMLKRNNAKAWDLAIKKDLLEYNENMKPKEIVE